MQAREMRLTFPGVLVDIWIAHGDFGPIFDPCELQSIWTSCSLRCCERGDDPGLRLSCRFAE